jgi:hypothetical protein
LYFSFERDVKGPQEMMKEDVKRRWEKEEGVG